MTASGDRAPRPVPAGRTARGAVVVPPSKSVSHRYLNLALLARQPISIERLLDADDIRHFRGALVALGFGLRASGDRLAIEPPVVSPDGAEIQCGNAGTLYRFLTATLTVVPGRWVLDGSPRLRERPIRPLVDALRSLGARIRYRGGDGQAPLEIEGGSLRGGETSLDAAESSQYASALIMAGTCAPAPVRVRLEALSSSPYLELTVEALRDFGVEVGRDASRTHYHVEPGRLRAPRHLVIEGDYSAATYPAVAALVTGGRVRLAGLRAESAQGDRAFFDLLVAAGARVGGKGRRHRGRARGQAAGDPSRSARHARPGPDAGGARPVPRGHHRDHRRAPPARQGERPVGGDGERARPRRRAGARAR